MSDEKPIIYLSKSIFRDYLDIIYPKIIKKDKNIAIPFNISFISLTF